MDIIEKILEKHTKLCTCREVYKIDEDVEIGVHQDNENIYMYAYSCSRDRNISIESNFKKLWNRFKSVAEDGYIKRNKGYSYSFRLKSMEGPIEDVEFGSGKIDIEDVELTEFEKLSLYVQELIGENEQLRFENDILRKENKELSSAMRVKNERGAGAKSKFNDEQILEIKRLRATGESIRKIAKEYNCSVGLVHKLINENMSDII